MTIFDHKSFIILLKEIKIMNANSNSEEKTTYLDYLALDQLLNLQQGFKEDESQISSDELHFIIVHQT